MAPRVGVVTFPGSLDDGDARRAVEIAGGEPVALWHKEQTVHGVDAVVLPGGFSYGDYLRCGAIARFSPVMTAVVDGARGGLPVLGICNGFQILCESHLLPGALTRNDHLHFVCRDQRLRVDSTRTAWTSAYAQGQEVVVPLKNGEGGYVADERTLDELEAEGRVVARYLDRNPNGSRRDIAGIGGYGNCLGLPNVGGEIQFDPSYLGNPLVNALCVGVMRHEDIKLARASGPGNLVVLFGAKTGGDA